MDKFKIGPFVKWAGGKNQLLYILQERVPKTFDTYFEPFIGGGALLLNTQPQKAVINDVNNQLLNVYEQLRLDAEKVIAILKEYDAISCDKECYYSMRSKYNEIIASNTLDAECAAITIWINKHCFNGLYRVNKMGNFNVPFNNKASGVSMDESNLRYIGEYLRTADIKILHGDFEAACSEVSANDFVYFDSPYVPINETANFTDYTKDGFSYEDHKRLSDLFRRLNAIGAKLMLSNHDVPLVHELYDGFKIENIDVRRSINRDASKRVGKEVIITNY